MPGGEQLLPGPLKRASPGICIVEPGILEEELQPSCPWWEGGKQGLLWGEEHFFSNGWGKEAVGLSQGWDGEESSVGSHPPSSRDDSLGKQWLFGAQGSWC